MLNSNVLRGDVCYQHACDICVELESGADRKKYLCGENRRVTLLQIDHQQGQSSYSARVPHHCDDLWEKHYRERTVIPSM